MTIEDIRAKIAELEALLTAAEEVEEVEDPQYDITVTIGGRERHGNLTGTKTTTGCKIYEVVDDPFPPQGETAPALVDGVLKELPLSLNGARFFVQGGIVMANMLRNRPWTGVYHPLAYTDNAYVVKADDEHPEAQGLYGTLPEEPPVVSTGRKEALPTRR